MFELIPRIPLYLSFRYFGFPKLLPLNLVVSVTYRCNSRCKTCNIWQRPAVHELTIDEYERIFAQIGRAPYYLTFSGGEPFLRRDLPEIVALGYECCHPGVITIPTNGLLAARIPRMVEEILHRAPNTQLGINLSLDDTEERHDEIRGVPGNYAKALETYQALRALNHPNLVVSIHTVISRFNITRLPKIYAALRDLDPDSYITEIAEERVELSTIDTNITPAPDKYAEATDFLIEQLAQREFTGFARITQAFRRRYYQLAARVMQERRQIIPCQAGWASGHIAPNGDVWACCIRAAPLGNLRETEYDLCPIWSGEEAEKMRTSIRNRECYCPMANASYSNMLLHPPTLARVALELLR